ncbi:MAG: hypothetical protein JWO09_3239 [Bacteroidetes bacterium]|nr:hypothetical protein [Bacteroidota bacterium]
MKALIPHLYAFVLPLFIGNMLHMLVVKKDMFRTLAKPISIDLFGSGKTYRGFILLPLMCACCSLITSLFTHSAPLLSFSTGFLLGFFYMLGELPNSWLKRRMGIPPGGSNANYKWLQLAADKLDSLIVLAIAYYFLVEISFMLLVKLILLSFIIHIIFSWILFRLRIKKSF